MPRDGRDGCEAPQVGVLERRVAHALRLGTNTAVTVKGAGRLSALDLWIAGASDTWLAAVERLDVVGVVGELRQPLARVRPLYESDLVTAGDGLSSGLVVSVRGVQADSFEVAVRCGEGTATAEFHARAWWDGGSKLRAPALQRGSASYVWAPDPVALGVPVDYVALGRQLPFMAETVLQMSDGPLVVNTIAFSSASSGFLSLYDSSAAPDPDAWPQYVFPLIGPGSMVLGRNELGEGVRILRSLWLGYAAGFLPWSDAPTPAAGALIVTR